MTSISIQWSDTGRGYYHSRTCMNGLLGAAEKVESSFSFTSTLSRAEKTIMSCIVLLLSNSLGIPPSRQAPPGVDCSRDLRYQSACSSATHRLDTSAHLARVWSVLCQNKSISQPPAYNKILQKSYPNIPAYLS